MGRRPRPVARPGGDEGVTTETSADVWRDVVGQDAAVRRLSAAAAAPVHAYLLIGPNGSGKRSLTRAFAALLLSAGSDGPDRDRHVRLALSEQHPDLRVVEPEGQTFRRAEAEALAHHANLAPIEGTRKVVVGVGCEAIEDEAAGYLLKAVEEPSASTVFVLLATEVVPELVTIASRCARVEVRPLPQEVTVARLLAEGVDEVQARSAAAAANGDLDRARTLATDPRLAARHDAWRTIPRRLDGTGHRSAMVVAELEGLIDEALGPLRRRQAAEAWALEEQIERYGLRGSGKRDLETRHRREIRRFRTAELQFGFATLAGAYREALVAGSRPAAVVAALDRIDAASVALMRYPNETLLLEALVSHLPPVESVG